MDIGKTKEFVGERWDTSIVPTLSDYIAIPNQSPMFDPQWATNGHLDKVVALFTNWIKQQNIEGLTHEVVKLGQRTPVIFVEVQATKKQNAATVLLYGHMDKQPPLESGWLEGLHPYKPVIRDGKLYGRGGADDGYALFGALTAIQAVKKQNIPHDRYVVLIEACEESGSFDLPFYIEHLKERIAVPTLIVCLDSGCGNYEQLWMTSSLRGMVTGVLKVEILKEGVHSGHATGIVPSTFRIARSLLERIESVNDGTIIKDFHVEIPAHRVEQAKYCADVLGNSVHEEFPFVDGAGPISHDNVKLLLNRSWAPALAITGVEGIPALQNAGNVLRPYTSLKLSLRLPPTLPAVAAANRLKEILEKDIPYGAKATFTWDKAGAGWESPALQPWLEKAVGDASEAFFQKKHVYTGEGGSIPFMGMLGEKFPKAQFLITGVLGPGSNAHGPNEFLHIEYGKRLVSAVAYVLAEQAAQSSQ
jgi:acetylornithine deacetylase/succinyl-diaminopimelate desuccinylase-like protein